MTRISTGEMFASALLGVQNAQAAQALAGKQVASGLKADDLKGYADQGSLLQAQQTVSARTQSLLDNNAVLAERLGAQSEALANLSSAAEGASKAVGDVLSVGDGTTLMQSLQGWFSQAAQALNADYAGQPLFAGGTTDQPPLDTSDVNALAGSATAASHLHDGDIVRIDRIDESTTVRTGLTASGVGGPLVAAFKAIADYDQPPTGPLTGKLTQTQISFLTSQLSVISSATATVRTAQTQTGVLQAQVDTATASLTARKSAVDGLISNRTTADPAEAASRLQQAGVTLQASAQVFAALSSTSLLNALQG